MPVGNFKRVHHAVPSDIGTNLYPQRGAPFAGKLGYTSSFSIKTPNSAVFSLYPQVLSTVRLTPLPPKEGIEEQDCFAWFAFADKNIATISSLLTAV